MKQIFSLIIFCKLSIQLFGQTLPVVQTITISAITASSASSGGNISSEGSAEVTARGVVWSTSVNPVVSKLIEAIGSGTTSNGQRAGSYNSALTFLQPNTVYYVRAYATNIAGTAYGNQLSFRTGTLPLVSTTTISSITANAASGGGNVTDSGSARITTRGIVWGTSPKPTIGLTTKTMNGTGIGSFASSLTGLTPGTTYYIRAYATSSAGTTYGNEVSFMTNKLAATLNSLNCTSSTNKGTLTLGNAASLVNSVVSYTGGNGGTFTMQSINSTGVMGLTATLAAGTLANGSGSLTFNITGTPTTAGTANFLLSLGGQTCTLTRLVSITAHTCGATNVHNATVAYGSLTDQEGNKYATVQIGAQTWMAENLRTTIYRNGTPIPNVTDNIQWLNNTTGAYCSYNNSTTNDCPYGKLYNWFAVNNTNQLCPAGWHVPSDDDWNALIGYLDPSYYPNEVGTQSFTAGGKMKSIGTQFWAGINSDANNSSGFSGLPGGGRGLNNTFNHIGNAGQWWSSTQHDTNNAWGRDLLNINGYVSKFGDYKSSGFSVRCLKERTF